MRIQSLISIAGAWCMWQPRQKIMVPGDWWIFGQDIIAKRWSKAHTWGITFLLWIMRHFWDCRRWSFCLTLICQWSSSFIGENLACLLGRILYTVSIISMVKNGWMVIHSWYGTNEHSEEYLSVCLTRQLTAPIHNHCSFSTGNTQKCQSSLLSAAVTVYPCVLSLWTLDG